VVRHIDQSICLKTGSLPNAAFDCFSSTTVRLEPPDSPERRHKIVSDRYTTTNPKKFPEAYLARRYTELRVGIVGRQIGPAIVNQLIRDRFWAQRQAELERYPDAWKYAKESLELARAKRAEYGLDQVAA
jgi:hypothetical protein